MKEKFPHPESKILEVLKGKVSEPIETISQKPGHKGEIVSVSLIEEGSGMVGLKNIEDNREWSGIFNHVMITARLASFLAQQLKEKGATVDPNIVLNTVLVSHSGRRQWDETRWYPDATKTQVGEKTDTQIALELLEKANISPTVIENVKAHEIANQVNNSKNNWVAKVALYADYRTSQKVMSLEERFKDLERLIVDGRITKKELSKIKYFYQEVEKEIFSIIQNEKPENISDTYPKAPLWENYIRRLYVQDAEENIFKKYSTLKSNLEKAKNKQEKIEAQLKMDTTFPQDTWWGKYTKELYEKQGGKAYQPSRIDVEIGIQRAIKNFKENPEK